MNREDKTAKKSKRKQLIKDEEKGPDQEKKNSQNKNLIKKDNSGNQKDLNSNLFTKEDTIRYFMLTYCYTKWWINDPECKVYFDKNCHKLEKSTDECKAIGLKQFIDTYDGRVCIKTFFSKMTIANRGNLESSSLGLGYPILRPFVNFCTLFIMFFMLVWKAHQNQLFSCNWDSEHTTDSDYSVLLQGLPTGDKIDKFGDIDVRTILEKKFKAEGYNIASMNFIYDTEKFLDLKKRYIEEKIKLAKKDYIAFREGGKDSSYEDKRLLNNQESIATAMMKSLLTKQEKEFHKSHPKEMVGAAFISFVTAKEARRFLKRHKKRGYFYESFGCFGYQNHPFEVTIPEVMKAETPSERKDGEKVRYLLPEPYQLYAEMPPEPSEVIWENQDYTKVEVFWRRIAVLFMTFLVFVVGFMLLMGLTIIFVSLKTKSSLFFFILAFVKIS